MKVIAPGEIGIVKGDKDIGTFAVGSPSGCRGYLAKSDQPPIACVAHVDFESLDQTVVDQMRKKLEELGASEVTVLATPNSTLPDVEKRLPIPEFSYNPHKKELKSKIPQEQKISILGRLKVLSARLRGKNKAPDLIEV